MGSYKVIKVIYFMSCKIVDDSVLTCKDNKNMKIAFFFYLCSKVIHVFIFSTIFCRFKIVLLSSFSFVIASMLLAILMYHYAKHMTHKDHDNNYRNNLLTIYRFTIWQEYFTPYWCKDSTINFSVCLCFFLYVKI